MLTPIDVTNYQTKWGNAITDISKKYLTNQDYMNTALDAITELYAYDYDQVLFKPTKSIEKRFRPMKEDALCYFVGNEFTEDTGFAINGGKGWSNVLFKNHNIYIKDDIAIAMGVYTFTCASTKEPIDVEYTMGMKRYEGNLRIFLHHSSIPYSN